MAEMQSPIAGGLSGARNTLSGSSVLGRPVLSSSLSKELASIADSNTAAVLEQNQVALQNVSNSITRIGGQMSLLNSNLMRISELTTQSAALENLKQQQESNQERILAEQQLREGKESIIEKKMQSVLVEPVRNIGAKAQFSLTNLMSFFNQLFFGWLLNQGVQTIVALTENNGEKLNEIKDNVIKNLRDVGLTLLALQNGFGLFRGGLLRIGTRIAQAVALQLFQRPIKAFLNQLKNIVKTANPGIYEIIRRGIEALTGKDINAEKPAPASPANMISEAAQGLMPGSSPAAGAEETPAQFGASMFGGLAGFGLGSKYMPGPGWLKVLSGLTFSVLGSETAKNILGNLSGTSEQAADMKSSDAAATTDMKPEDKSSDATATISAKVSAPSMEDKAKGIPELPKPAANVTVIEGGEQQQQPAETSSQMGLANRAPSVASSNPDNPYPLFSIVQYNVIGAIA